MTADERIAALEARVAELEAWRETNRRQQPEPGTIGSFRLGPEEQSELRASVERLGLKSEALLKGFGRR